MAEETDGVGEAFEDSLRIGLTVAAQLGQRLARHLEQQRREREAVARQEARELQARFDAERSAARASLAPLQQKGWWDTATTTDIAAMHETATAWKNFDDVARTAEDDIREQVKERYGIDVNDLHAGSAAVGETAAQADRDQRDAARAADETSAQRKRAAEELATARALLAAADRSDDDAHGAAERGWREDDQIASSARASADATGTAEYDSAERRAQFAASLQGIADQRTIDARILADGENAKHPREAVTSRPARAGHTRGTGADNTLQRDRGGRNR